MCSVHLCLKLQLLVVSLYFSWFIKRDGINPSFHLFDMKHPAGSQMDLYAPPPCMLYNVVPIMMFTAPWLYLKAMNWCNALRVCMYCSCACTVLGWIKQRRLVWRHLTGMHRTLNPEMFSWTNVVKYESNSSMNTLLNLVNNFPRILEAITYSHLSTVSTEWTWICHCHK